MVNLSSYSGQTILIRFRVVGDTGTSVVGWFIDAIRIGSPEPSVSNTAFISGVGVASANSNTTLYLPLILK